MNAKWYYMRDNHTFLSLKDSKEEIKLQLLVEGYDNYTHGMLCTKTKGYEHIKIHANGSGEKWLEFIDQVLEVVE